METIIVYIYIHTYVFSRPDPPGSRPRARAGRVRRPGYIIVIMIIISIISCIIIY